MPFTKTQIQQEVRELKAKRAKLEAQIKHLEGYLGTYGTTIHSTRVGIDIRPTLKSIFKKNNNQPMKVKDIIIAVAKELSIEQEIVSKKLEYAKRNVLDKTDAYGMYRLQQSIFESP